MLKKLIKICVFLATFIYTISFVNAYEIKYDGQVKVDGIYEDCLYFTRTSIADEKTLDRYKEKTRGRLGLWVNPFEKILPDRTTYKIAYYMFSKSGVDFSLNSGASAVYGYKNGELLSGSYMEAATIEQNEEAVMEFVTAPEEITISMYKTDKSGAVYVENYTTKNLFEYAIASVKIEEVTYGGNKIYVLYEQIVFDKESTSILYENYNDAEGYTLIPVFYTQGSPLDTETPQTIYADRYFYAYEPNHFLSMKTWNSDIKGTTNDGIYSFINYLNNTLRLPDRYANETVTIKHYNLLSRLKSNINGGYDLEGKDKEVAANVIKKFENFDFSTVTSRTIDMASLITVSGTDEIFAYYINAQNSKAGIEKTKPKSVTAFDKDSQGLTLTLDETLKKQRYIEIYIYSVPKKLTYTVRVWHVVVPDSVSSEYETGGILSIPDANLQDTTVFQSKFVEEEAEKMASNYISDLATNNKESIIYEYKADPNNTVKLYLSIYNTKFTNDAIKKIVYKVGTGYTTPTYTSLPNDVKTLYSGRGSISSSLQVNLKNLNTDIIVYYRVSRAGSPSVIYNGTLTPDTTSADEIKCGGILSIPNEFNDNTKVYFGLTDALTYYVKGMHTEYEWITTTKKPSGNNSETNHVVSSGYNVDEINYPGDYDSNQDGEPDSAYNTSFTFKIVGLDKTYTEKITNFSYCRVHKITDVAVYCLSEVTIFDAGYKKDTLGNQLLEDNFKSYTYSYNFAGNDKIKITVKNLMPVGQGGWVFQPQHAVRYTNNYEQATSTAYPFIQNYMNSVKDFKTNLMDIIAPYAFPGNNATKIDTYARDIIGDSTYGNLEYGEVKNYDFDTTIKNIIAYDGAIPDLRASSGNIEYVKSGIQRDKGTNAIRYLEFTLDFTKIYIAGETKIYKLTKNKHGTVIARTHINYTSIEDADANQDKIINIKDIKMVYEATNTAYSQWLKNKNQDNWNKLKEAYTAEKKVVSVYDEALVMQALKEMLANLNEIGVMQYTGLTRSQYVEDAEAWVQITDGAKTQNIALVKDRTSNNNISGIIC